MPHMVGIGTWSGPGGGNGPSPSGDGGGGFPPGSGGPGSDIELQRVAWSAWIGQTGVDATSALDRSTTFRLRNAGSPTPNLAVVVLKWWVRMRDWGDALAGTGSPVPAADAFLWRSGNDLLISQVNRDFQWWQRPDVELGAGVRLDFGAIGTFGAFPVVIAPIRMYADVWIELPVWGFRIPPTHSLNFSHRGVDQSAAADRPVYDSLALVTVQPLEADFTEAL